MSLNLFGMRLSTCTQRVAITLLETGAPFTFHAVDLAKREQKSPEYLEKHQPFGQIPSLWDGDFHVFESRAIATYIASAYDKTGTLYPTDVKARAIVDQWINVELNYYTAAAELASEFIFKPRYGRPQNLERVPDLEKSLHTALAVLNKHLEGKTYFTGDNFTVADIVYIPYTNLLVNKIEQYKTIFDAYPSVNAWWAAVNARPSVAKALAGDY